MLDKDVCQTPASTTFALWSTTMTDDSDRFPIHEEHNIDGNRLVVLSWEWLNDTDSSPRAWENVQLWDQQGRVLWTVSGMEKEQARLGRKSCAFVGALCKNVGWTLIDFAGNEFLLNTETGTVTFRQWSK
jgi:hypothetical protein